MLAVNYFLKKLHLRYLCGYWINLCWEHEFLLWKPHLWIWLCFAREMLRITNSIQSQIQEILNSNHSVFTGVCDSQNFWRMAPSKCLELYFSTKFFKKFFHNTETANSLVLRMICYRTHHMFFRLGFYVSCKYCESCVWIDKEELLRLLAKSFTSIGRYVSHPFYLFQANVPF